MICKALIFDLDGTLVDSAAIVDQVMMAWCDRHGIDFATLQTSSHSMRTVDTVREAAPHLDAEKEAQELEAMEREALSQLTEIAGAAEFLWKLPAAGWAVATSSDHPSAKAKLQATQMPLPQVLVTADQVQQGKPHPEAYLTTSQLLGLDPCECLAFEDSEAGVRSALSAGCRVILIGHGCQISSAGIVGRIADFRAIELVSADESGFELSLPDPI